MASPSLSSTAQIMLALASRSLHKLKDYDPFNNTASTGALASTNIGLHNLTIFDAKMAAFADRLNSPVEIEINEALTFIDDMQTKFKEIGTSASRTSSETLSQQTSPLIEEANTLKKQSQNIQIQLKELYYEFNAFIPTSMSQPNTPETVTRYVTFENTLASLHKQLDQLRAKQLLLSRQLELAERTGVNLLPDTFKIPFIAKLDERHGPS